MDGCDKTYGDLCSVVCENTNKTKPGKSRRINGKSKKYQPDPNTNETKSGKSRKKFLETAKKKKTG